MQWLGHISTEREQHLRSALRDEAEALDERRRHEPLVEESIAQEAWDASKHPRLGGPPNPGWWATTGGAGANARLIAAGGAAPMPRPTYRPSAPWLPRIAGGAGAGAGAAAGVAAGGLLGGLRNASMGAYWGRIPGVQAMPQIWAYELQKRIRAGTLSREDAEGILTTAVTTKFST
ncbi:MAG: hypothetical protein HYX69_08225 [Planctomycetia bacterium]|nr:hypothetical protein [Planctomycetia bacterium]